jgi:uncharacterized protein (TIGR02145 family)/prepilin-type N-terminal cleavage/methylation domain-containing protein
MRKQKEAFSLIELIVTMAMAGALSAISSVTFTGYRESARLAKVDHEQAEYERETITKCVLNPDDYQDICPKQFTTIGGAQWRGINVNVGEIITSNTLATDGSEKWCLNNDESNCDLWGGLYTRSAALNICHPGYRLPNSDDDAVTIAAIESLGVQAIWGGGSELNVPPVEAGHRTELGAFDITNSGIWRSDITGKGGGLPIGFFVYNNNGTFSTSATFDSAMDGYYVRCLAE